MANSIVREKRLQVGTSFEAVGAARIPLRPFHLVVWATLQLRGQRDLKPNMVWLPCVVDTGFNGTFCIAQEHLELLPDHERFVYLGPREFAHRGGVETARRVEADLWLRSEVDNGGPVKIELPKGFYAFPRRPRAVMLGPPLVGQAALSAAEVRLEVDYQSLHFSLYQTEQPGLARFIDFRDSGP